MVPYIILFIIIIFISIISFKIREKYKLISNILIGISIISLSFFAAFRSIIVGKDTSALVLDFQNIKQVNNFFGIFSSFNSERLYNICVYVINKFFGNYRVFLFIQQFVISLFVYLIALKDGNKSNRILYIISYLFLTYNMTFNIIRQTISMFIILYGFKYIEEKKYKKYILMTLIASSFHTSAIICLTFPLLNYIANKKNRFLYLIIISLIILISYSFLGSILSFIDTYFDAFRHYSHYINIYRDTNLSKLYLNTKIIMTGFVLIFSLIIANRKKIEKINYTLVYMLVLDVVLFYLCAYVKYGYRLSYFFFPFYIYFIPRIYSQLDNKQNKIIYTILIIIMLIVHWVIRYSIVGYDGTIPYIIG